MHTKINILFQFHCTVIQSFTHSLHPADMINIFYITTHYRPITLKLLWY